MAGRGGLPQSLSAFVSAGFSAGHQYPVTDGEDGGGGVDSVETTRTYNLYGLRISSPWPLPAVEEAKRASHDVEFIEGSAPLFCDLGLQKDDAGSASWRLDYKRLPSGGDYLRWAGLFEFLVSSNGCQIVGRPLAPCSLESFTTYLAGPVLSFALLRRCEEPLHATAVVVDGQAIGFLGDSGYGKSSLAAAFVAAGYRLLTDDLLVLRPEGSGLVAFPGPQRIKLVPHVARRFLGSGASGPLLLSGASKQVIPLPASLTQVSPVPLKGLYALAPPRADPQNQPVSRHMTSRKACMTLLANTFNSSVVEPERLSRQLAFATRVAGAVAVRSLSRVDGVAFLPRLRDAILADLTSCRS
jgi:hypothetical protein